MVLLEKDLKNVVIDDKLIADYKDYRYACLCLESVESCLIDGCTGMARAFMDIYRQNEYPDSIKTPLLKINLTLRYQGLASRHPESLSSN